MFDFSKFSLAGWQPQSCLLSRRLSRHYLVCKIYLRVPFLFTNINIWQRPTLFSFTATNNNISISITPTHCCLFCDCCHHHHHHHDDNDYHYYFMMVTVVDCWWWWSATNVLIYVSMRGRYFQKILYLVVNRKKNVVVLVPLILNYYLLLLWQRC